MDIGLMMDGDYHEGQTQREAFDAVLTTADLAETLGFDSIWLAERHFSPPGGAALVSSIGSAPLLVATAIATRTSRLRIGTAVLLFPLGHPVRLAEEVATLDHLSQGRLDLGIGRSSFPRAYDGYNIPYEESRARFREYLDVMRLAWTQPRFSYSGTFYTCRDLEVLPKPYQHPHPPLHQAAATRETFATSGRWGYRCWWRSSGLPCLSSRRSLRLTRLPGRLPATPDRAKCDCVYRSMWQPHSSRHRRTPCRCYALLRTPAAGLSAEPASVESAERTAKAAQLATLTYEEVLQERAVFGTPRARHETPARRSAGIGLIGNHH